MNEQRLRISSAHVGFQPANRGGAPPNAERCLHLLQDILDVGFDQNEAGCNGVCIMETLGSTEVADGNAKQCEGNDMLAPSVEGTIPAYRSLSHSHTIQALKKFTGPPAPTVVGPELLWGLCDTLLEVPETEHPR